MMETPEIHVLRHLRDTGAQIRRNPNTVIARAALEQEERIARKIEALEAKLAAEPPTKEEVAA